MLGNLPFLVKGLTVSERTAKLQEEVIMPGSMWAETDFGAFDSTVALEYREIEWEMIKEYLDTTEQLAYIVLICCTILQHVLLDKKKDELGFLEVQSMRYSGEPLTSIGNGLINEFVGWSCPPEMHENPVASQDELDNGICPVRGLREGDDGFACAQGKVKLDDWGLQLGFNLDVDWYADFRAVKFCGRYLSGDFNEHLVSVCDVRRTLDKLHLVMGVTHQDKRALLRSKLLAAWNLDGHTPMVATIVWALWPSVADAKVITANPDKYKMKLAGTANEPGYAPPIIRDVDYNCLVYQGICPEAARRYDRDVVRAALLRQPLPRFDFGLSTAKVHLCAVSGV